MRHIFVSRVGGPAGKAKIVAAGAALAGAAILLSACGGGGSGVDGEYLSTKSDDLLSLVVEGSSVTYTEIHCDGDLDDAEMSVGELNEDRTAIAWTKAGRFENSSEVTITENAIDISGWETFSREGSDAGKAVRADQEEGCADQADSGAGAGGAGSTTIENGTYVDVSSEYEVAQLAIDGTTVTLSVASCQEDTTTKSGTVSGQEITWDDGSGVTGELAHGGNRRIDLTNGNDPVREFFPNDDPRVSDGLTTYEKSCGVPML